MFGDCSACMMMGFFVPYSPAKIRNEYKWIFTEDPNRCLMRIHTYFQFHSVPFNSFSRALFFFLSSVCFHIFFQYRAIFCVFFFLTATSLIRKLLPKNKTIKHIFVTCASDNVKMENQWTVIWTARCVSQNIDMKQTKNCYILFTPVAGRIFFRYVRREAEQWCWFMHLHAMQMTVFTFWLFVHSF